LEEKAMILSFKDWLTGNMGIPGEYQFTKNYWISLALVILSLIVVIILASSKRIDEKNKNRILKGIALFQLGFEVLWRLIYLFVKKDNILCWWPTYPCNLGGIILPIIALTNSKLGKKMFYLFGFVGACLTFAVPEGIFSSSVMIFPIIKSILQHTGLLLIPAFEFASNKFRPSLRYFGLLVLGCLIHLFNCEVVDRWLGFEGDYMFFRSGMPFVIEGVPQYITLSVFALIVLALLSFVCDIKDSMKLFKKK
jgi:uncharacterized membrane protein YwaF